MQSEIAFPSARPSWQQLNNYFATKYNAPYGFPKNTRPAQGARATLFSHRSQLSHATSGRSLQGRQLRQRKLNSCFHSDFDDSRINFHTRTQMFHKAREKISLCCRSTKVRASQPRLSPSKSYFQKAGLCYSYVPFAEAYNTIVGRGRPCFASTKTEFEDSENEDTSDVDSDVDDLYFQRRDQTTDPKQFLKFEPKKWFKEPSIDEGKSVPGWLQPVSGASYSQTLSMWGVTLMTFLFGASVFMVASLLPVYMKTLGTSQTSIGTMEGLAISCSFWARGLSGVGSDVFQSRMGPILFGAVLQLVGKPLTFCFGSVSMLVLARILDRFAKGIRAAPTDALLADLSPTGQQGSVYGLYHSSSTLGSMTGGMLAVLIMKATSNNYQAVFAASVIPCFLALLVPIFLVKEPAADKLKKRLHLIQSQIEDIDGLINTIESHQKQELLADTTRSLERFAPAVNKDTVMINPLDNAGVSTRDSGEFEEGENGGEAERHVLEMQKELETLKKANAKRELLQIESSDRLGIRFYKVMAVSWVLYTARFSEAFLTLRAVEVGLPVTYVPGLLVISLFLQTGLSYPLGKFADEHLDRYTVLLLGFGCLAAANLCCLYTTTPVGMIIGMFFQGLHMSATEGNLKAWVAQSLPLNMRGTGFSIFALSAGSAVVVGNMGAGLLADHTLHAGLGGTGPFYQGLISTCLASMLLVAFYQKKVSWRKFAV